MEIEGLGPIPARIRGNKLVSLILALSAAGFILSASVSCDLDALKAMVNFVLGPAPPGSPGGEVPDFHPPSKFGGVGPDPPPSFA